MEEIFQEYDLSDEEFGELINFLYLENIPEVRVAVENNDFAVINNENIEQGEYNKQFDASNLPSGVYKLIMNSSDGETITKSIVIQK